MELIIGIIIGLIILTILVALHEFGHAIAARRNGVVVKEFGIGFPPRAWGKKLKNGVLFTLNWLPIGGFVRLQGEHDAADKPGDFGAATFWQKTKIMLMGVLVNWVVAIILFTVLAVTGLPKLLPNQFSLPSDTTTVVSPLRVGTVNEGSPAAKAGIKPNDEIVQFNHKKVAQASDFSAITKQSRGKTVAMEVVRDGRHIHTQVTLRHDNADNQGYLGVGTVGPYETIKATWSAPIVGVVTTAQLTGATFQGLGEMVANVSKGVVKKLSTDQETRSQGGKDLAVAKDSVAGPVSIIGVLFPAAEKSGPTQLALMTAIISLSLAVINTVPIPGLDGGRWATMALFRVFGKKLTKEREENIQATGMLMLFSLIIIITIIDIGRFF